MSKQDSKAIDKWVKQLCGVQLPVLSGVMQELNQVTQSSDSCATQLSEIILKDSALTTKVLRIANSAYHSPGSNNGITTISRAVVQLGFQGIKAISLSVMLVDSLLKQNSKERMLEWMARGFHTAIQAENLFKASGSNEGEEEIFITSLMLHVAEMAFWSSKNKTADALDKKLESGSAGDPELENRLLGCTMADLNKALATEWHLGEHVEAAMSPGSNPSKSTEAVLLGQEIALATEKGWDSQDFRDVVVKASLFSGMSLPDVQKMIEKGAAQAAGAAVNYGANKVCNFIPSTTEKVAEPEAKAMKPDPQLQLDVLREMGAMVEQMVDINTLFQMVVEGIHRGIGLERVCLCLIDPKVTTMTAKYILGDNTDEWRTEMQFPIKSDQDNLFAHCLHSKINIYLKPDRTHSYHHLINKKMKRIFDVNNCLISSIFAGNRSIGLLVADRGVSGVDISDEQHESFEHFSQQTNMSLAMLAAKRNAK